MAVLASLDVYPTFSRKGDNFMDTCLLPHETILWIPVCFHTRQFYRYLSASTRDNFMDTCLLPHETILWIPVCFHTRQFYGYLSASTRDNFIDTYLLPHETILWIPVCFQVRFNSVKIVLLFKRICS